MCRFVWYKNSVVVNVLEKLAKKHNDWIKIVQSFGCDLMTSEDLVQDMYIKIHYWYKDRNDRSIMFNRDEINYYFIYKALRTVWLNYVKQANRNKDIDISTLHRSTASEYNAQDLLDAAEEKLQELYWYDRKIFELVYKDGISMLQISEKTGIDYCSIKRTIRKVKKILK